VIVIYWYLLANVAEKFFSSRGTFLELTAQSARGHRCVGLAHASHGSAKVLCFYDYTNASWLD
jgi:hypothetical protein